MNKIKNKLLSAVLAAVISVGAFAAPDAGLLPGLSVTAEAASVSKPTASLKSGTYNVSGSKKVKLSCKTKGAVIYYSLNNSAFKKYTSAITIKKNSTLRVYAEYNGVSSGTATYKYKLTPLVKFSPNEGTYKTAKTVKITTKLSGVSLYYTTDGSKPTKNSKKYTSAGIKLTSDTTLRVLAVKSGFTNKYYIKDYYISGGTEAVDDSDVIVETESSLLNDYTKKYYYNYLDSDQKKIYKDLWDGIGSAKSSIDFTVTDLTTAEIEYVIWMFYYDNPQFFWFDPYENITYWSYPDTGYCTSIDPGYYITGSELTSAKKKVEAAADKMISKAKKAGSTYDMLVSLHDSIVENTIYNATDSYKECTVFGPLVYGYAQCVGYAQAYSYLCQKMDVQCIMVTGSAGGAHAWNKLQIGGDWVLTDVTWDDYDDGAPIYSYFCLSDEQMSKDHTEGADIYVTYGKNINPANTTKYNYMRQKFTVHSSASAAYTAFLNDTLTNYKKGILNAAVYCDKAVYSELIDIINNELSDDLAGAGITSIGYNWDVQTFDTVDVYSLTILIINP